MDPDGARGENVKLVRLNKVTYVRIGNVEFQLQVS